MFPIVDKSNEITKNPQFTAGSHQFSFSALSEKDTFPLSCLQVFHCRVPSFILPPSMHCHICAIPKNSWYITAFNNV